jgi:hypothetical protein
MGDVNELKGFSRGQIDAALMMIGQSAGMSTEDGIKALLRGDIKVVKSERSWYEKDGIIYITVTSDGTTGSEWVERLVSKGFYISEHANKLLNSSRFISTNGIVTKIAIVKGELFSDSERITRKIRTYAKERNFAIPNAEVACLIREKFTDNDLKAMGLYWVIVMHENFGDFNGGSRLLNVDRNDSGSRLHTYLSTPDFEWNAASGFAFVA